MKPLKQWLDAYEVSHQDTFNKRIHYIFVPLIFFSIIGLFVSIPTPAIINKNSIPEFIMPFMNFGILLIVVCSMFYFRLSIRVFIGMLILSILFLWANHLISMHSGIPLWKVSATIFIISWVFQFIGHQHEGEKPSFLNDLQFLLIGPVWILSIVYKKLGINH